MKKALLYLPLILTMSCADCGTITVSDDAGVTSSGALVINEFMARNATGITDENGAFEDWIELYNGSEADIDLEGYGLSDDRFTPAKYVFPAGININAGGYLVIFADAEPDEGPLHANFRLSGDGESLLLSNPEGEAVDQVSFGPQNQDRSEGRFPNATGPFLPLEQSSPAAANTAPGLPDAGVADVAQGA